MSRIASVVITVTLLAALLVVAAYAVQRRILFPVPPLPNHSLAADVEVIRLALPFGVVEGLLLAPVPAVVTPSPLLVFTHGNGELADDWPGEFEPPRRWGWAVLLLEYPGYGRSGGVPSEATIAASAEAAYQWARHDPRIDASRIVAYGRSLGGAVAARLAADHGLPGLILESAFTSVRPFAARFFVPGFLVRDPLDALDSLARYRGPLLVLHGRDDTIVPIAHGRALAAAVAGAIFHELPCGHNDCPRPWTAIEPFLRRLVVP
jgi:pimeloyl-ACP methyl ester carboxylesterase